MRLVALDSRQALVGEVQDIFEREASIFVIIEAVEVPQMVEVDFQLLVLRVHDVVQSQVLFVLLQGFRKQATHQRVEARGVSEVGDGGAH